MKYILVALLLLFSNLAMSKNLCAASFSTDMKEFKLFGENSALPIKVNANGTLSFTRPKKGAFNWLRGKTEEIEIKTAEDLFAAIGPENENKSLKNRAIIFLDNTPVEVIITLMVGQNGRELRLEIPKHENPESVPNFDPSFYSPKDVHHGARYWQIVDIANRYALKNRLRQDAFEYSAFQTGIIEGQRNHFSRDLRHYLLIYMHNGRSETRYSMLLLNVLLTEANLRFIP